jgi:hypothetical protein
MAVSAASNPILFEDQFEVLTKDPDGKRFDKVSRFVCRSTMFDFELTLDVNIDIYPLAVRLAFASLGVSSFRFGSVGVFAANDNDREDERRASDTPPCSPPAHPLLLDKHPSNQTIKNKKQNKTKQAGDRLTVALARTIHLDGTAETGRHDASSPLVTRAASLMDGYEYVMHGRVFKYTGAGGGGGGGAGGRARVEMIASFGGLLLKLGGEAAKLQLLEVDSAVYLLVRKL